MGRVMSDDHIRDWMQLIGRTRGERVRIVADLLQHHREDRMTSDDRLVCIKALRWMGVDPVRLQAA